MMPVRLDPAAPWSLVKHSTTEPLHSHNIASYAITFETGTFNEAMIRQ